MRRAIISIRRLQRRRLGRMHRQSRRTRGLVAALVFWDLSRVAWKPNANPYCVTKFVGSADFLQQLNRNDCQIRFQNDGRRVVRCGEVCWGDMRTVKSVCCLNSETVGTKRTQAPLFSPIFSGKAEKIGPSETVQKKTNAQVAG